MSECGSESSNLTLRYLILKIPLKLSSFVCETDASVVCFPFRQEFELKFLRS